MFLKIVWLELHALKKNQLFFVHFYLSTLLSVNSSKNKFHVLKIEKSVPNTPKNNNLGSARFFLGRFGNPDQTIFFWLYETA